MRKLWGALRGASFGRVLGDGLIGIGLLFATIDSVILFRGWSQWGLEWWDKLSYGIAAASIPWVLVVFPFIFWVMWLRSRWRALPHLTGAGLVYAIFIAYSLVGAMGSIAVQRQEVIAQKSAAHDNLDALKDQRNRYRDELGWIQSRRPAGQVEAALAAEKIKRQWEWTEGCKEIRGSSQRTYCTNVQALQGELAAARKAEDLHKKLADLTGRIEGRAPVSEKADPMASSLAFWLGKISIHISEAEASTGLPITTPVVLLLGELLLVYFGFIVRGITHKSLLAGTLEVQPLASPTARAVRTGGAAAVTGGELVAAPALPPPLPRPVVSITRQAELCTWFFRNCVRHAPDGALPEADWYGHYCDVCAKSGDEPLPLDGFRRFAERHVPSIKQVEGVIYYRQVLPLIPKESAA